MHRQNTPAAPSAQILSGLFDDVAPVIAEPPATTDRVEFTVITSDRRLSKRFTVRDGRPAKLEGDATLSRGYAQRMTLTGSASAMAEQLAFHLETLGAKNALICAPPPAGQDRWPVLTKEDVGNRTDVIARTKATFRPARGLALMGLDFDTKDYPEHIRQRLLAMPSPNLSNALIEAFPDFDAAASVSRSSMSAGVRIRGTDAETDRNGGLHRYFFVKDGSDVAGFAERLRDQLMVRGWVWGFVTESGEVLLRTLFDVVASSDTSRLFYEGEPVLEDERLEFLPERRAAIPSPGGFLDTSRLPALTAEQRLQLAEVQGAARRDVREEAEAKRAVWLEKQGKRPRPTSTKPLRDRVADSAVNDNELMGDFPIQLDDGRVVSAREVLARPSAFHKLTGADPLEPEYGGGSNKAIIYSDCSPIRIESQAHGGITYLVVTDPHDVFEDLGPKPRDVFGDGDSVRVLDVPKGALPDVLERWAVDVSERIGAPPAFAAVAGLATISGAIGSKLRIQPKEFDTGWTEPAFLWFGIVEAPGGRKSPIIAQAVAPLSKVDSEKAKRGREEWGRWEQRRKAAKKTDLFDEPEPKIQRHVVDNFTVEALGGVLADNPAGVLVSVDELTGLIGSFDAYKSNRGGDRPMMLRLFDGRENRIDRVGRKLTFIECWGASVIGGIQPRKITEMASDLDADGLLQRFIPVWGDGSRRAGVDRAPDRDAVEAYDAAVRQLANAEFRAPHAVTLSPEAQALWRPLSDRLSALTALAGLSDAWAGHLGKWPGISARLLLICHVLDHLGHRLGVVDTTPVSAVTAERALRLVDWLLGNSLRFYAECIGAGQAGDDAKWIAGHILSAGLTGRITRRDLGQAKRDFRNADRRVVEAMRFLETAEWCVPEDGSPTDQFGPTRWTICPEVSDGRFASRAAREQERRARDRQNIEQAAAERRRLLQENRDDE